MQRFELSARLSPSVVLLWMLLFISFLSMVYQDYTPTLAFFILLVLGGYGAGMSAYAVYSMTAYRLIFHDKVWSVDDGQQLWRIDSLERSFYSIWISFVVCRVLDKRYVFFFFADGLSPIERSRLAFLMRYFTP